MQAARGRLPFFNSGVGRAWEKDNLREEERVDPAWGVKDPSDGVFGPIRRCAGGPIEASAGQPQPSSAHMETQKLAYTRAEICTTTEIHLLDGPRNGVDLPTLESERSTLPTASRARMLLRLYLVHHESLSTRRMDPSDPPVTGLPNTRSIVRRRVPLMML